MYKFIFRTVLAHLDPEKVHHLAIYSLAWTGRQAWGRRLLRAFARRVGKHSPAGEPWAGLKLGRALSAPFGLAAGLDKNAQCLDAWEALGFGFVEIGTVTPRPQAGNEKPRLWRLLPEQALRNAMGFNNDGAAKVANRLRDYRLRSKGQGLVVGANIGKNKLTPAEFAADDYRIVARALVPWVDFLVINVSSPNTPGLRDLQAVDALRPVLRAVQMQVRSATTRQVPVLVKIAPDLADEDIVAVAALVKEIGLDGVVATNTTINHPYGSGGVSGPPLRERAVEVVRILRRELGKERLVIGVGGISEAAQAQDLLQAGANLVEGLTGFIYAGPSWPARLNTQLGGEI